MISRVAWSRSRSDHRDNVGMRCDSGHRFAHERRCRSTAASFMRGPCRQGVGLLRTHSVCYSAMSCPAPPIPTGSPLTLISTAPQKHRPARTWLFVVMIELSLRGMAGSRSGTLLGQSRSARVSRSGDVAPVAKRVWMSLDGKLERSATGDRASGGWPTARVRIRVRDARTRARVHADRFRGRTYPD